MVLIGQIGKDFQFRYFCGIGVQILTMDPKYVSLEGLNIREIG